MPEVYLLQNQSGLFLSSRYEWVDGREANKLYKTVYKDEAINTKVELTVKNAELRISLTPCETNDKGIPVIDEPMLPSPSISHSSTNAIKEPPETHTTLENKSTEHPSSIEQTDATTPK